MKGIKMKTHTKEKIRSWIKTCMIYCIGLFILALGVCFSVKSNLGVSPVSSVPYVISLITTSELGFITAIVLNFYVVLQLFILRRDFGLKHVLQVLCGSLFGVFVTLANGICTFDSPDFYPLQVLYLIISIFLVAVGLMFYLAADLIPQPAEGIIITIASKINKEFSRVKVWFDCTAVMLALTLSFIFMGTVQGVREGTIIAAVSIGKIAGILSRKYKPYLIAFCK